MSNWWGTLLVIPLLSGCSLYDDMSRWEIAWQGLHAIDVGQTMTYKDDPCYSEANFATRRLIGTEPSESKVLLWGVGMSALHIVIFDWVDQSALPVWAKTSLHVFDLAYKAVIVTDNYNNGVRVFSSNRPSEEFCYE